MRDPPLTPAEKLREALAALEAAMERLAVSFDQVAALLTRTPRPAGSLWTPRPGAFGCGSGCRMVEIILSEHQLACLKAAVPKESVARAALDAADYFAARQLNPQDRFLTVTWRIALAPP